MEDFLTSKILISKKTKGVPYDFSKHASKKFEEPPISDHGISTS